MSYLANAVDDLDTKLYNIIRVDLLSWRILIGRTKTIVVDECSVGAACISEEELKVDVY